MNLVNINVYGEGYYSGNSYKEAIFLLEEDYNSLEEDFNGKIMDLGELDGKHSQVDGEIYVEIITEEEQLNYKFDVSNDGESLYWELDSINTNIDEMIKRANNYIESLDRLVEVKFTVKKSQIEAVNNAVYEIINQ